MIARFAFVAVLAIAPSVAAQSAWPVLRTDGSATIERAEATARCQEDGSSWRCVVRLRFVVVAVGPATLCEAPCLGGATRFTVDSAPLAAEHRVEAGARLEVRSPPLPCVLEVADTTVDSLLVQPALGARHAVLGESALFHPQSDPFRGPIFEGTGAAPIALDDHGAGGAELAVEGDELVLRARTLHGGPPEGPLAHGGPAISIGGRFPTATPGNVRARLAVGYELGLVEHLVISGWIETDFDALYEALVIEAALPGAAILLPSLSAGIGVVARQLGDRDADAALRIRLAAQWFFVGFVADLDYYPAIGGWVASVAGRLSI